MTSTDTAARKKERKLPKQVKISCRLKTATNGKVFCSLHRQALFYVYYTRNSRPRFVCCDKEVQLDAKYHVGGWYPEP